MSKNSILPLIIFPSFKDVKAILSSWAVQKQVEGRSWPVARSVLTPA